MGGGKNFSKNRTVASLFKSSEKKHFYEYFWQFDNEPTWIVNSNFENVESVEVWSSNAKCQGSNIVKVHGSEKQVFYLTKNSKLKCHTIEKRKVKVHYNYYDQKITNLNENHLSLIKEVLEALDNNNLEVVVSHLKKLGLYNIFREKITLKDLRQIDFQNGDYVHLEINPQVKNIKCPDGKCSFNVDVFGPLEYDKLSLIKGMNQLKYQELPPFLFFCGSRYAAGSIYFRADVKMEFEHYIDENGFSCDVNSFILSEMNNSYQFYLNWISKQTVQKILLGSSQNFLNQKRSAITKEIALQLESLERFNLFMKKELTAQQLEKTVNGYIELWWEPFDKCKDESEKKCLSKEMIMTRSRLMEFGSINSTTELSLASLGLKQTIESKTSLVAFTVKLCPEQYEDFIFELLSFKNQIMSEDEFKSKVMDYQSSSCEIKSEFSNRKEFNYRWLLASIPMEIEKEEVDLIVEDYKLLESPGEDKLKNDLFQQGKIYFDIYMKSLKQRQLPFKRSRIIEIKK